MSEQEPITGIEVPIYLKYNFTAGAAPARFLSQVKRGVLTGQRCPLCEQVYFPPRGSCAACGVPTQEEVVLADKATVESFTIVAIPIPNNPIKPPENGTRCFANSGHRMWLKIIDGAVSLTIRFCESSVFKGVVDEIELTCEQPMRIRVIAEALEKKCASGLRFDLAACCYLDEVCIRKRGKRT